MNVTPMDVCYEGYDKPHNRRTLSASLPAPLTYNDIGMNHLSDVGEPIEPDQLLRKDPVILEFVYDV